MSNSNSPPIATLLGVVASVIAIWAFVTGWPDIKTTWTHLTEQSASSTPQKIATQDEQHTFRNLPNVSTHLMRVTRGSQWETILHFTLPASEEGGITSIETQFTLPADKGLLGSSANSGSQAGFMNSEMTIFAVNHQPFTKTSYVYLFLRSQNGLQMLHDVNNRISLIVPYAWKDNVSGFLRVEYIIGREIFLQSVDFTTANRQSLEFSVSVNDHGEVHFINAAYEGPAR